MRGERTERVDDWISRQYSTTRQSHYIMVVDRSRVRSPSVTYQSLDSKLRSSNLGNYYLNICLKRAYLMPGRSSLSNAPLPKCQRPVSLSLTGCVICRLWNMDRSPAQTISKRVGIPCMLWSQRSVQGFEGTNNERRMKSSMAYG